MDEVYREMFLLESKRPGSEMGLALALLRACVAADVPLNTGEDWNWLRTVSPIGLKMIEDSLNQGSTVAPLLQQFCNSNPQP